MSAQSYFLVAQTDADTFAEVTGLEQGRGFDRHGASHARGGHGGLYPRLQGRRIADALSKAGIGYSITGANSVNQGLRNLRLPARAAAGVEVLR